MTPISIPVEVFFGFVISAISLGVFCLIRNPPIFAGVAFVGIFLLTISVITGNMIMGYSNTNPQPTSSYTLRNGAAGDTIFPPAATLVYADSDTRVIDSGQFGLYGTRILQGESFPPNSIYIGKSVNCIIIPMQKVGNPTGNLYVGVFNNSTHPTTEIKALFGYMDVTQLTTGWRSYKFCLGDSIGANGVAPITQPLNLAKSINANDVYGVLYENATVGNTVQLLRSFNNDIGSSNGYLAFSACWDCPYGVFQVTHQIMQITYENYHTQYTYNPVTEIDFPFTDITKVLFATLGTVFMLIGALMGLRDMDGFGYGV